MQAKKLHIKAGFPRKVAYIIPGYKHSVERKIYQDVIDAFNSKSVETIPVNVKWKYHTISQNTKDFLKDVSNVKADKIIYFGFSYGALISFLASIKAKPDIQILCSLSPYFNEDLPNLFKSWKRHIGKRRLEDFKTMNANFLSSLIKSETYLLYGTKEGKFIEGRAKNTFSNLSCKKYLIAVSGAKHDIGDKNYFKEIKKIIYKL